MKYLFILSFVTTCLAELPVRSNFFGLSPPNSDPASSYGPPSYSQGSGPYPPSQGYNYDSAPPTKLTKHIYVHVPPPDDEEYDYAPPPAPKKDVKIIFIKAPSYKPRLPPPQRNHDTEKTIVYVLYKKPELEIPVDDAPKPPTKPEVYFIKYKTQKEQRDPAPVYGPPPTQYGVPNDGPYHK